MTRVIRIDSCHQCPGRSHTGGFGRVAYVPICRTANRELPYSIECGTVSMVIASQKPGIPDWCPLEKLPEQT
jgi:hypothetical protein